MSLSQASERAMRRHPPGIDTDRQPRRPFMRAEYLNSQSHRMSNRARLLTPSAERRTIAASGRIIALLVGHGTGVIRLATEGKAFFHRADVEPGTSINDFELGDAVEFDLVDDPISGARALRVRRPAVG
jgi:hypothetical protein